ncbi:MAG TPA: RDD family protein [Verrucomicrobiae bacterium]
MTMEVQYKIIGGDGVEYGPVTLDEIKDWILDGRVAGMTRVWRSDLAVWSAADRYSELLPDLARLHAVVSAQRARACGFWARLAAYIIDRFILAAIFVAVWSQVAEPRHWKVPEMPAEITPATTDEFRKEWTEWMDHALPILYPILLLYEVLLNGRFGATVGKMIIGAKITKADGSRLTYPRAFLRWFAERISEFCFFVGYFMVLTNSDKRGLHDWLAGTKVVWTR